jgi:hypothetical protein
MTYLLPDTPGPSISIHKSSYPFRLPLGKYKYDLEILTERSATRFFLYAYENPPIDIRISTRSTRTDRLCLVSFAWSRRKSEQCRLPLKPTWCLLGCCKQSRPSLRRLGQAHDAPFFASSRRAVPPLSSTSQFLVSSASHPLARRQVRGWGGDARTQGPRVAA